MVKLFADQGGLERSTEDPFEKYLAQGLNYAPLVLVYEAQYVDAALAGTLPQNATLVYLSPTTRSAHTVVAFDGDGDEVGRLLTTDAELLRLAAEHGFRTADEAVFAPGAGPGAGRRRGAARQAHRPRPRTRARASSTPSSRPSTNGYDHDKDIRATSHIALAMLLATGQRPDRQAPHPAPPKARSRRGPAPCASLAGSELADLEPDPRRGEGRHRRHRQLTEIGTLDGIERVAAGTAVRDQDAIWFSSNRYLELHPDAAGRIDVSTKVANSPVVLGLRAGKAKELGWDSTVQRGARSPTAAGEGRFTYGMTNPAASNSGYSALVGVAGRAGRHGTGADHRRDHRADAAAPVVLRRAVADRRVVRLARRRVRASGSPAAPRWTGWSTTSRCCCR